jgi:hypothetical protein
MLRMKEFFHIGDAKKDENITGVLETSIEEQVEILDTEYGADRDVYTEDGGYVVLLEEEKDFQTLYDRSKLFPKDESWMYEYVDLIVTKDKEYAQMLFLLSNDYGVVAIVPTDLLNDDGIIEEAKEHGQVKRD